MTGKQTSAAERTRRYRARRKAGAQLVRLEITREVLECLIAHGWTSKVEAQDHDNLSNAVWNLLDCWERGMLMPDATLLHEPK